MLGELSLDKIGYKVHGLHETQKKWKQKGYAIKMLKSGICFKPTEPLRTLIKGKGQRNNSWYSNAKDEEDDVDEQLTP